LFEQPGFGRIHDLPKGTSTRGPGLARRPFPTRTYPCCIGVSWLTSRSFRGELPATIIRRLSSPARAFRHLAQADSDWKLAV
jgi:hypothetical protein